MNGAMQTACGQYGGNNNNNNNNKIQLGWDYHDQVGAYRRTGILGKEWVLSRVSCEPGEEAGGDGAHVLVNAATYLRICRCR